MNPAARAVSPPWAVSKKEKKREQVSIAPPHWWLKRMPTSWGNLAGHTLANLVMEQDIARTRHPWVGPTARLWEPEPLRFAGVHGLYRAYHLADARESAGRPGTHPLATVANLICGR